jgi:phosphatidylserine decarboxylase
LERLLLADKHNELIAREGWIFFFPTLLLCIITFMLGLSFWIWSILGILAFYIAWFFRNPYRKIPAEPGAIVSPADGKVVGIRTTEDGRICINVFLNIFNVHVNRSPIEGKVEAVNYRKGKFLNAMKPEASAENECNGLTLVDGDFRMDVIQIAGLIARRIICWSKEGDQLARGERFGLIRFGSRVDIFLPGDCEVRVKEGQKVSGGSDIIAIRPSA